MIKLISRKWKHFVILFAFFILISLIKISGQFLDKRAEHIALSKYNYNKEGVIEGLQSRSVFQGKNRAILFVHGFMSSPAIFSELVDDIKNKVNSDIYVPLLPFHGRDLVSASQFNNKIILDYLYDTITSLSKRYDSLTIVGMSYGGALVVRLAIENKIPNKVHLILYAPAFFLQTNTYFGRAEAFLYNGWRKYCNYAVLGCVFPGYPSGDVIAKPMFDKEKSLPYVVIPALLQLYQFDLENRKELGSVHRPHSLIVAVDDNRVSYSEQKAVCLANKPYCHFYSFTSGKHIIHWGKNKKKFENLLIKLVSAS